MSSKVTSLRKKPVRQHRAVVLDGVLVMAAMIRAVANLPNRVNVLSLNPLHRARIALDFEVIAINEATPAAVNT
jgi:hypothetical protein